MTSFQRLLLTISLFLCLPACSDPAILPVPPTGAPSTTPNILPSPFPTLASTLLPSETPTQTPVPAPSETPTETLIPSPTFSPIPSETATPVALRAEVLEQANCRYGPGAPYLYKYGLVKGSNLEVIGRREDGEWIYVQAIGGGNPCWVKTPLMQVNGAVQSLEVYYPAKAPLPQSPYYPATAFAIGTRSGNQVTVTWQDVPLRAGDEEDENMQHYIIEVWRCEAGQTLFEPLATNDLSITFTDEPGCGQPSHGRVFVQEKHGFAGPTEIVWP